MQKTLLMLAMIVTMTSCVKKGPLVIGHRGAMGHETENSLASVQKALDLGVDMMEIDVFKIKSNEIVVFHDQTVDRLTNGPGNIEEYTISDLQRLILDGGHKIPMLQDVLKLIDNQVALNIELKGANTADRVNHIIKYYAESRGWDFENFIISSFRWDELEEMRRLNPKVRLAVLAEDDPLLALPTAIKLNAEAINPHHAQLNADNVAQIKEAGFKIYTWTVNEPKDIQRMKDLGVDGIITDYPDRVN
ncbi:glycerophosphodiester phosphodiesterase [Maribacter sp. 2307ULW6-5]|uniref:glycerophosphodiester phosphodiesterase n=1 Tax=Maribacter sp. 2307ULW6-5 TaxID=3386275 RepID=UPI0039BC7238